MRPILPSVVITAILSTGMAMGAVSAASDHAAAQPDRISVYFPAGAARLTEEAQAVLDETAKTAKEANAARVVIVGYAEGNATDEAHDRIASQRAYSVEAGLIDRGLDPNNIFVMAAANRPEKISANPAFIDERRADVIIETDRKSGF